MVPCRANSASSSPARHRGLAAAEPGEDHRLGDLGDGQLPAGDRGDRGVGADPGDGLVRQAKLVAQFPLLLHRAPQRRVAGVDPGHHEALGQRPLVQRRARPPAAARRSPRSPRPAWRAASTSAWTRLDAQTTTSAAAITVAARSVSRSAAPGPAPTNHDLRCRWRCTRPAIGTVTACLRGGAPGRHQQRGQVRRRAGHLGRRAGCPHRAGRGWRRAPRRRGGPRPGPRPAPRAGGCRSCSRPRCRNAASAARNGSIPAVSGSSASVSRALAQHGAAARREVLHGGDARHGGHRQARAPAPARSRRGR